MPTKDKTLRAKHRSTWYLKHAEDHKAKIAARQKRIVAENQEKVYDYLESHACVDCGESNPIVLEFDHNDPANKRLGVSIMVNQGYIWETIQAEIAKCSVRCGNCHQIKTSRDGNFSRWKIWIQRNSRGAQRLHP